VDEAELSALLRDPAFALRSLLDVRHALAHLGRGLRDEEVGGQPAEIEVAIGGDHLVTHGASQGPTHTPSPRVRASTGAPPAARSGRSRAPGSGRRRPGSARAPGARSARAASGAWGRDPCRRARPSPAAGSGP